MSLTVADLSILMRSGIDTWNNHQRRINRLLYLMISGHETLHDARDSLLTVCFQGFVKVARPM